MRADLLVKVPKNPEQTVRHWRRYGPYVDYIREFREFVALNARLGHTPEIFPREFGFVATDRGLGLVVEKFSDNAGNLAPTVRRQIIEAGLDKELEAMCDRLFDTLLRTEAVVSDITPKIIVS